jgi:DNA-binding transcriptional LysR family regulator
MTLVELHHLQLFVKVAATGSFSRAATLIGSTQSSVSKRMAELEQECGHRLFERNGRGVSLNEAGRWLLPRAESLVTEATGLAANLSSVFAAPQGIVRLAIQPSVAWPLVDRLHGRLKREYPGVGLQVLEGATGDLERWVREGRADLALVNRGVPHDTNNATYLFSTSFHLISQPGDHETARPTIRFRELHRLPLVAATLPNGGRVLMDEAAKRAGISLAIAIEVNSVHLLKRLVAAGRGYGLASLDSIATELAAQTLQAARIVSPQLQEHFSLIGSQSRHPSVVVRTVALAVQEVATGLRSRRR